MGRKMNRGVVCLVACFTLLLINFATPSFTSNVVSSPSSTPQEPHLVIFILGSLRTYRLNTCGFVVVNDGNSSARNVSYNFALKDISERFGFTYEDYIGEIPPSKAVGVVFTRATHGYGFISISVTIYSSNGDNISKTVKGFQLGYLTIVFGR